MATRQSLQALQEQMQARTTLISEVRSFAAANRDKDGWWLVDEMDDDRIDNLTVNTRTLLGARKAIFKEIRLIRPALPPQGKVYGRAAVSETGEVIGRQRRARRTRAMVIADLLERYGVPEDLREQVHQLLSSWAATAPQRKPRTAKKPAAAATTNGAPAEAASDVTAAAHAAVTKAMGNGEPHVQATDADIAQANTQGMQAHAEGRTILDNPHTEQRLHDAWLIGWNTSAHADVERLMAHPTPISPVEQQYQHPAAG